MVVYSDPYQRIFVKVLTFYLCCVYCPYNGNKIWHMDMYTDIQRIQDMKRVLIALGRTNGIINKHSRALSRNEISPARLQMLSAIAHFSAPTISFIARSIKSSRQNVSVLVNGMVRDNLVVMVDNPNHKKSRILRLTEEGKRLLDAISSRRDILCHTISEGIHSEDLQTTIKVLNHICKVMEK